VTDVPATHLPPSLGTPEFRLVAAACAAAARQTSLDVSQASVDARTVAALIERHRLSAPVMHLVAGALVDPAVAAKLTGRARRQRVLGLEQARQTVMLSQALKAAGIAHFTVKGAALSQALYGDVSARASKDIDLLVDPARMGEAGDVIAACGFVRTDHDTGEVRKHRTYAAGAIQIELHNRLVDLPAYVPLGFDALWSRRATVSLLGQDISVMGEIDTLLYLCAHGSEHVWFRLKWLQDIARIIVRDRDGSAVVAAQDAARAAGFDRVLAAMLALVADVFDIRPALLRKALSRKAPSSNDSAYTRRAVALARTALAAPAELAHVPTVGWIVRRLLVQWGSRRDWRYRRALLADIATGPRSFDTERVGSWGLLHLPARAVRFWRSRRRHA